eukprot:3919151-Prymnesium_polylepis.1
MAAWCQLPGGEGEVVAVAVCAGIDGGVAVAHGGIGRVDDGEVEVVLEPGAEVGGAGGEAAEGVTRLGVEEGVHLGGEDELVNGGVGALALLRCMLSDSCRSTCSRLERQSAAFRHPLGP